MAVRSRHSRTDATSLTIDNVYYFWEDTDCFFTKARRRYAIKKWHKQNNPKGQYR